MNKYVHSYDYDPVLFDAKKISISCSFDEGKMRFIQRKKIKTRSYLACRNKRKSEYVPYFVFLDAKARGVRKLCWELINHEAPVVTTYHTAKKLQEALADVGIASHIDKVSNGPYTMRVMAQSRKALKDLEISPNLDAWKRALDHAISQQSDSDRESWERPEGIRLPGRK